MQIAIRRHHARAAEARHALMPPRSSASRLFHAFSQAATDAPDRFQTAGTKISLFILRRAPRHFDPAPRGAVYDCHFRRRSAESRDIEHTRCQAYAAALCFAERLMRFLLRDCRRV